MKRCETCGTPHPDNVTTSHHPDNCKCGLSICGGTGPAGCIWCLKLENTNVSAARLAQLDLVLKRSVKVALPICEHDAAMRLMGGIPEFWWLWCTKCGAIRFREDEWYYPDCSKVELASLPDLG